ncbi:hypothetical protein AAG570_007478 [Ranatra chinensis]|uniref:Reverse transcriptase domain-containing protein n=1 Tax=Ranatra chinensis TaxID=642074 RepID=A0ABD0XWA9_9HEMI
MDEFLEGLDEGAIQVYMDDIIVFSRSEQEHGEHLVQLLRRLKEFGLKVSREKTMFFQPSVKFLGYVVSEGGIHPDPGKVEAIKNLQVPVDVKGVRLPWGAVLSQLDHLGDRPVAFASRKLTSAESRYSAIERELLGVVWAVEYFRPYLWGRQFLIKTDHKPLVWVGGLKETSARVARWEERLTAYSFTISHNKGKDNVVADCLSRMVNALDAPTPSPGPSRRRPRINGSEDSPEVVDLPLLEHPEGESSIIPGLDLLRRLVVEEPDLPTVQVPASRETPSRSPEPDRRNVERRAMTWLSDTLDDKARQLVLQIVSGDTVRSTFQKIGQNQVWKLECGSQAQNRDICRITDELVEPGQTYYVYGDTTDG